MTYEIIGVEVLQPCEEWGTDPEGNKYCSQYSHNIIAKFKAKCSSILNIYYVQWKGSQKQNSDIDIQEDVDGNA